VKLCSHSDPIITHSQSPGHDQGSSCRPVATIEPSDISRAGYLRVSGSWQLAVVGMSDKSERAVPGEGVPGVARGYKHGAPGKVDVVSALSPPHSRLVFR